MKKVFFLFAVVLMTFTSCVSTRNVHKSNSLAIDQVRLELSMQDFEYLGTATVDVEYTKYGLIRKIHKINGKEYDTRNKQEVNLLGVEQLKQNSLLRQALAQIVEQYPDADYFVPLFHKVEKQYMFGGHHCIETMSVKVYRLKH